MGARCERQMKKLFLTGIAVLFLATGAAHAGEHEEVWAEKDKKAEEAWKEWQKNMKPSYTPEERVTGIKKQEYTRYVLSGVTSTLGFLTHFTPSCGLRTDYENQIMKEPEHGTAELVPTTEVAILAKDSPFFHCSGKKNGPGL